LTDLLLSAHWRADRKALWVRDHLGHDHGALTVLHSESCRDPLARCNREVLLVRDGAGVAYGLALAADGNTIDCLVSLSAARAEGRGALGGQHTGGITRTETILATALVALAAWAESELKTRWEKSDGETESRGHRG